MNEENIIQEYLNGKSMVQLSKETSLPYCRIQKILKDNKIAIRGGRKKIVLTEEQKEQIKKEFFDYVPIRTIAANIKSNVNTVNEYISSQEWTRSKNRININIKSDYFSTIDSAEKAYWLGFLFTDGSVDQYKGSGRIRLQLQEADLEILEKFKEDIGIDGKISYDKRANSTCCSVEFVDQQIFNDLAKYNIIPRKTYNINHIPFEQIPKEYLPSYLLGLFDGDGGLSISADCSTDVTLNYTAYCEQEVKEFQSMINSLCNIPAPNRIFFTSAWHCQWRGRLQVLKILNILYKNCPRHLQRKYDKYLMLKESLD